MNLSTESRASDGSFIPVENPKQPDNFSLLITPNDNVVLTQDGTRTEISGVEDIFHLIAEKSGARLVRTVSKQGHLTTQAENLPEGTQIQLTGEKRRITIKI